MDNEHLNQCPTMFLYSEKSAGSPSASSPAGSSGSTSGSTSSLAAAATATITDVLQQRMQLQHQQYQQDMQLRQMQQQQQQQAATAESRTIIDTAASFGFGKFSTGAGNPFALHQQHNGHNGIGSDAVISNRSNHNNNNNPSQPNHNHQHPSDPMNEFESQYNSRNKNFKNMLRKEPRADFCKLVSQEMSSNVTRERLLNAIPTTMQLNDQSSAVAAAKAAAVHHRNSVAAAAATAASTTPINVAAIGSIPQQPSLVAAAPPGHVSNQHMEEIEKLQKAHDLQKQMLWDSFQEKNKQLEMHHQIQLEQKIKFATLSNFQELHHAAEVEKQHQQQQQQHQQQQLQQQQLQQQQQLAQQQQHRERRAREMATATANAATSGTLISNPVGRRKELTSANASSEVKQKLQNFLMNKKQNAATNGMTSATSPFRSWGVVKSSSGESLSAGTVSSSHPYKIPQPPSAIGKYDPDFPLRKTASEPNLLKRLKQSVIERKARNSPAAVRRQERILQAVKRRQQKQPHALSGPNCGVAEASGPNSPPQMVGSRGSPTSAPIQEENEDPNYQEGRGCLNEMLLYPSPSMPNISLGRPLSHHHLSVTQYQNMLSSSVAQSVASYYAASNAPTAMDLQQSNEPPPSPLSARPDLPPQAHSPAAAAALHLAQIGIHQGLIYSNPITDAQVAHARLNKQGHRPLGRTQSAPLPLGHPMLTGSGASNLNIGPPHYEDSDAERQTYEQQHALLTAKIRQTVLNRSNVKMNRVTESQLTEEEDCHDDGASASSSLSAGEVIDLTDKRLPPKTVNVIATSHSTGAIIPSTSSAMDECRQDSNYLQHQREILNHFIQHHNREDKFISTGSQLARTLSSPLVHFPGTSGLLTETAGQPPAVNLSLAHRRNQIGPDGLHRLTTGLAYDNIMLKHSCTCGDNSAHPEHSGRLQSVWARLVETGLASRCDRLRSRKATQEQLQTVHTEEHTMLFGSNQMNRAQNNDPAAPRHSFVRMACGGVGADSDTTWNEHHTASAARMAAGCVIDLAFKTVRGDVKNGFAVVRPPGHHAEPDLAMGFCFFNSIAIAAKLVRQRMSDRVERILIVDWDIHHGNGTQQVFYDDPNVLYLSVHRHDDGHFFPGTGGPTECGTGPGIGYNVNVSWSGGLEPPLGDAEYLAAFRTVVMPIAREFSPDLVLVSAGFDAASGHTPNLGGYVVSAACFGHMTRLLMQLAGGKVVLALEGGYDLPAICDSSQECVKALLGDEPMPIAETELRRLPIQNAVDTLQKTIAIQMSHWPCVKRYANTVAMSALEAAKVEQDESETVTAMAGLSMQNPNRKSDVSISSRSDSAEPMEQDDMK